MCCGRSGLNVLKCAEIKKCRRHRERAKSDDKKAYFSIKLKCVLQDSALWNVIKYYQL